MWPAHQPYNAYAFLTQTKEKFFFFSFSNHISRLTLNDGLMDHLDPVLTTLAHRIPILIMHIQLASRRVLSGCRQDHLLIIIHGIDPLALTREGERVAKLLATALVRLIGVVSVLGQRIGEVIRGAAIKGREVAVGMASNAADNRVDHGDVSDNDGDEGFSAGPATGLLGAIGTGLVC